MLSKLREYAGEQLRDQLPPLYEQTPVAHVILLRADGHPVSERPIARVDDSTARGRRGIDMAAPVIQRASGIRPLLLADNGEYTFGRARDPGKQARATQAHQAYLELLNRCAETTGDPSVAAVQRFYERGGVELLELDESWDHGLKVTFEVLMDDGARRRPIALPSVRRFWLDENLPDQSTTDQCLVCGERKPVLDRLQGKIKGIRGGQSAGTSIISANSEAFESYGLKASRTAPTCRECGEEFTRGMNSLIAGANTHLYVSDTTFIFWTKNTGFDLAAFMQNPDPEQVKTLIQSVENGRAIDGIDDTAFYAAALSAKRRTRRGAGLDRHHCGERAGAHCQVVPASENCRPQGRRPLRHDSQTPGYLPTGGRHGQNAPGPPGHNPSSPVPDGPAGNAPADGHRRPGHPEEPRRTEGYQKPGSPHQARADEPGNPTRQGGPHGHAGPRTPIDRLPLRQTAGRHRAGPEGRDARRERHHR